MPAIPSNKKEIIRQLQQDILLLQGFKASSSPTDSIGLGPVESAFPHGIFPTGTIHEFVSTNLEQAAASGGFMAGLLSSLMLQGGVSLWISISRTLFPPALKAFGVEPDRIIFIDVKREKDALWAMEEALKCEGLSAVIAELREIDFKQSRRLQLAVEKSKVTGFVLRSNPLGIGATACAARWQITPLPSELEQGMPGVGFPKWKVELLKVRNGNPGSWKLEWSAGRFIPLTEVATENITPLSERKTG